jgi:Cystathionine beta-lyases/cystathionine gamma-synthases
LREVQNMLAYFYCRRMFTPELKEAIGIKDNFIRVSIGLESLEVLTGDIEQALCTCARGYES